MEWRQCTSSGLIRLARATSSTIRPIDWSAGRFVLGANIFRTSGWLAVRIATRIQRGSHVKAMDCFAFSAFVFIEPQLQ